MTAGRRLFAWLGAALLAVALTACAGLPTSGPVNPGRAPGEAEGSQEVFFRPVGPLPGATPQQIVEGFIRAGSAPGAGARWERAREFLAPDFRSAWRPSAGVIIDLENDRVPVETGEGLVSVSLTVVGTTDARGSYQQADEAATTLSYELAQQDDGEWRITAAPDGVVLDRALFPSVFHEYAVMYFSPGWEYLVPDVRWFPTTTAATSIVDALVNRSKSDWLDGAVFSAFPEGVEARPTVPVSAGVAEVELTESVLASDTQALDRMQAQLEASLATANVTAVQMSVDGTPLEATAAPVRSTRIPGAPLVLTELGFGYLAGDELEPVAGLTDVMTTVDPVAIQTSADRDLAALLLRTGEVARVRDDRTSVVLDERAGLLDPTIGPGGGVWSVPREDPSALRVFPLAGEPIDVEGAFPDATGIEAFSLSRDGTRLAAVVTAGGRSVLWVAGVGRGADEGAIVLDEPLLLSVLGGSGVDVAWLDDQTVGVLVRQDDTTVVLEQAVGGPGTTVVAPRDAASLAGGTSLSNVRLRGEDGALYVRRGSTWQQAAAGIRVLATQQGAPQ
ncbi:LpqB family beta-propeller domain-containing protein [Microbacterium aurantiacum]|uniref:GerMN domain-containing protein n=1 Tax=Microbacterium aurantiacum TaxID=162393 RepID=A0A0M8MNJ2_9MICO|nr:LpqB family beta-propeller domain-containing protein [Microbacterium chocolatum]ANG85263.1 hypothetical protein A8L33_07595 [Microbacterium chocolatum]KOS11114.1 hypothetical protein XI38_07565 [Microbacterium chocolatum]